MSDGDPSSVEDTTGQKSTTSSCSSLKQLEETLPEAVQRCPNYVPGYTSLHLSAQHRLQNMAAQKDLSSSLSRKSTKTHSKTVRRRVRSAASSIGTETTESDTDAKSLVTELDMTSNDVQHLDGNIYDETDEIFLMAANKEEEDITQKSYRRACRMKHIVPTSRVLSSLTTKEINLKSHVIGERGAHACAIALVSNGTVEKVDFEGNDIGPHGTLYICRMLQENIFITDLSLAQNNLGTKGLRYISHTMTITDTLKRLNLSANGFRDDDAVYIADILRNNASLEELNLSYNEFREKGGEIIGQALGDNSYLEVLDLSWNHLRMSGAVAIADGIGSNTSIKTLNLGWNGFHLEGCRAFATSLELNRTLEHLNLTCNRINAACLEYLLRGLLRNTTISHLMLARNPISSEGALAILDFLAKTPGSKMAYVNILGQDVGPEFLRKLNQVQEIRGDNLTVIYGLTMKQDRLDMIEDETMLLKLDPVTILMEYIRLKNLRLVDLFHKLDDDNNNSISKEEFKKELMASGIPVTEDMLDRIISQLDKNDNGEIEYNELILGQREHRRKVNRLLDESLQQNVPFEKTEIGSVSNKLRRIMRIKEYFWSNKLKRLKNAAKQNTGTPKSVLGLMKKDRNERRPTVAVREENSTPTDQGQDYVFVEASGGSMVLDTVHGVTSA